MKRNKSNNNIWQNLSKILLKQNLAGQQGGGLGRNCGMGRGISWNRVIAVGLSMILPKLIAELQKIGRHIFVNTGGKTDNSFKDRWYSCNTCGCTFNNLLDLHHVLNCALCGSSDIKKCGENSFSDTTDDICICPQCGFEQLHTRGIPCKMEICPKCNSTMMHKDAP